jgi:MFS superfamily sulfate permease-like transporter
MLAGIGVIIFLKQIPHAFGYDPDFIGICHLHSLMVKKYVF